MSSYYDKYLKYKNKYLMLKNQFAGMDDEDNLQVPVNRSLFGSPVNKPVNRSLFGSPVNKPVIRSLFDDEPDDKPVNKSEFKPVNIPLFRSPDIKEVKPVNRSLFGSPDIKEVKPFSRQVNRSPDITKVTNSEFKSNNRPNNKQVSRSPDIGPINRSLFDDEPDFKSRSVIRPNSSPENRINLRSFGSPFGKGNSSSDSDSDYLPNRRSNSMIKSSITSALRPFNSPLKSAFSPRRHLSPERSHNLPKRYLSPTRTVSTPTRTVSTPTRTVSTPTRTVATPTRTVATPTRTQTTSSIIKYNNPLLSFSDNEKISLLNSEYESNWVLTGSVAVKLYLAKLKINGFDFKTSDIDALALSEDRNINTQRLGDYDRVQKTPQRSVTFKKGDENIDVSAVPKLPRFNIIDGINVLTPSILLSYYDEGIDTREKDIPKIKALRMIINHINKNNIKLNV